MPSSAATTAKARLERFVLEVRGEPRVGASPVQRRRETGSIAPRKQTTFRHRSLSPRQEERLVALVTARPDATLAELRDALPTTAALSTLWRTIGRLGFTVKTNGTRRRTAAR
jgi:transposase